MDRPLFTGSVEHSLDDKARLVVPARFRERLGAGFFLSIADPEPCLTLYPAVTYRDYLARMLAEPVKDVAYKSFVRKVLVVTEEVNADANGRLVIPAALRAHAGIEKDVISIGTITHVEVWSKENYDKHVAARGELPDFAAKLGLF